MEMSARPSLHPQNGRIPDRGLERPIQHFRKPPVYVAETGEVKHETPLCPQLANATYHAWCREEALYAFGENWCDTCRHHMTDLDGWWTDPRYRRREEG